LNGGVFNPAVNRSGRFRSDRQSLRYK
jgi:hypothetical protein